MNLIDAADVPNFESVSAFAKWYISSGMPMLFPKNHEVFISDDATAYSLFRHGRFQFEIYLIHPNPVIPLHEHPGVKNIEIPQSGFAGVEVEELKNMVQISGQPHGGDFRVRAAHSGFMLMSAQMWDEGLEISTIGARWKGKTAGPKHEALIRRFNPGCLVYPGYADVTKVAQSVEIL
jgi:hypothetical protein